MKNTGKKNNSQYTLDQNGCFVINDYNQAKTFSNFFPGIAGVWGTPMWVFYVNRGQCISSFGMEGKDKAILEFQPANKAYRLTSLQGFRTFIKVHNGNKTIFWEPFQNHGSDVSRRPPQKLSITPGDLTIEETHPSLGITIRVNYFTIPQESFPALVRRVTLSNNSRKIQHIELVDGLPIFIPYGMSDWAMKNMSRTVEAWVNVSNTKNKIPYYHLKVDIADTAAVKHIKEGNFYFSFWAEQEGKKGLLDMLVDPALIFGQATDLVAPQKFLSQRSFDPSAEQYSSNRTPCAMSFAKVKLAPKKSKQFVSVAGHALHQKELDGIVARVTKAGYIEQKFADNEKLISEIKNYAFTHSASTAFDLYCGQTFLDNVMRGGLPIVLQTEEGQVNFNVYSRKHGDPERDYNNFVLSPTYFSQGNGNYRDVNQNRRNDVWFNTAVKDSSIINFLSLIQPDGYNPLIVKGMSFTVADQSKLNNILRDCVKDDPVPLLTRIKEGFQPGELLKFILQKEIALNVSLEKFLTQVLSVCHKQELADHGEGFWADHWTYNLDLIESFLSIYPEELRSLLLERKSFSFYHNSHYVLPREQRYLLTPQGVRQYHSVKHGTRETKPHDKMSKLRTENGQGEIYQTNLIGKLLCLIANKAASLDPSGVGIEMEADKPNWYDALNGLPGLLGSSISETLELKRLSLFLLESLRNSSLKNDRRIQVFEELADFIQALSDVLTEQDALAYWQRSNEAKERYRSLVLHGVSGQEREVALSDVTVFLERIIARTVRAVELAKNKEGQIVTYFAHEVTEYEKLEKKHNEFFHVRPLDFKRHDLPLFLEGFVHALRAENDQDESRKLYQALRKSPLFDKKLKMYKVNADLSGQTDEIGRTRVFPRGWLENESIWLHMEYKYVLELLRRELYDEFYQTLQDVFIPFLKPEQYGRSTLENSSFIVSSAHEDAALHGQGFVARLSGSTAEFLHIWLYMNVGRNPFYTDSLNKLYLHFQPALAGWLFTQEEKTVNYFSSAAGQEREITLPANTYAFNFLGKTLVVYHNPKRRNTFGSNKAKIAEIALSYPNRTAPVKFAQDIIPQPHAADVRNGQVERIDVYFK